MGLPTKLVHRSWTPGLGRDSLSLINLGPTMYNPIAHWAFMKLSLHLVLVTAVAGFVGQPIRGARNSVIFLPRSKREVRKLILKPCEVSIGILGNEYLSEHHGYCHELKESTGS
ncbi:Uncharacterized protein TCM_044476 [Theobroma cacao]|uniref:Uncharacterized protein n=1 Tax=Theobroma cacao TaxID=3641 RepID=A0A061FRS9_THECC|nr:Uncharacterized protein TCM_044476 [Theobroma cacao]